MGVFDGVIVGVGLRYATDCTIKSENVTVVAVFSVEDCTKTPNVPLSKLRSVRVNWCLPFKKKRISVPTTQTPRRTSAGEPGGTSPLGAGPASTRG